MADIIEIIKCNVCDCVLASPIMLPCGYSICRKHFVNENQLVNCHGCKMEHKLVKSECYQNKTLEKFIERKIQDLDFGKIHKRAMRICKELEDLINQANFVNYDPKYLFKSLIDEMRSSINQKREDLKAEIDEKAESLIFQVNNFKKEFEESLAEKKNFAINSETVKEKLSAAKIELEKWKNELKVLMIDEAKWKEIEIKSEKTLECLQTDLELAKKELYPKNPDELKWKLLRFNETKIVSPLENCLHSKIVEMKQEAYFLTNLCEFPKNQEWKILYRASENGFSTKTFHQKCDNKPKTLTIIRSANGNIFGGYTDAMWDETNQFKTDPNAFLFSLKNKDNRPIKLKIGAGREQYAIRSCSNYGPSFGNGDGRGFDLYIAEYSNSNSQSIAFMGDYSHPNYPPKSNEASIFLAGAYNFKVSDIEVFQKI